MSKPFEFKLPIDMQLNLIATYQYVMEANDLGDFWKKEFPLKDKEELMRALMGTGVAMVSSTRNLLRGRNHER